MIATYPRDIVPELLKRLIPLSADQVADHIPESRFRVSPTSESRARMQVVQPLPTAEVLTQLLDIAFTASLIEEEGRFSPCALAYVTAEGAQTTVAACLTFEKPTPLDARSLAKLAPAAESSGMLIGVWTTQGESHDLACWGLIPREERRFILDYVQERGCLIVKLVRPASLEVFYGTRLVARYEHGVSRFAGAAEVSTILRDNNLLDPVKAKEVDRLAARMVEHRHGGAILVVPADWDQTGIAEIKFKSAEPWKGLADALRAEEDFNRGGASMPHEEPETQRARRRMQAERTHRDTLDAVARWTAIDGALVMDNQLNIRGFGATIYTPIGGGNPDVHETINDGREHASEKRQLSDFGGNRHRSAILFCAQQIKFGLAIVASQDGAVSLFGRREDGGVNALRPFYPR